MLGRKILNVVSAMALAACSAPEPTEHARTIEAMKPPKRARPVIAVVADNAGTETTDFIVPYAVLTASTAADVFAVAPEHRPIKLLPALAIDPQLTLAELDARYPDGADYVIVPKIEHTADPTVVAWIQDQARRGAIIVGICSGVQTVAAAGLLDDRAATGHWYDLDGLRKEHPTMRWVRDRRYVVDRGVMTTTGVSASLPASLALVEAITGRPRAAGLAAELGVERWDEEHDSSAFFLDATSKRTAEQNRASTVKDVYALPVAPGVDDIALSFTADSWARTFRSTAITVATDRRVTTRYGLQLLPDAAATGSSAVVLPAPSSSQAGRALPDTLRQIKDRYGEDTARFVALQLEYAWPGL